MKKIFAILIILSLFLVTLGCLKTFDTSIKVINNSNYAINSVKISEQPYSAESNPDPTPVEKLTDTTIAAGESMRFIIETPGGYSVEITNTNSVTEVYEDAERVITKENKITEIPFPKPEEE